MTNPKDQDPRTDRPDTTDDDTEGHGSRRSLKGMPADDTQTDTPDDDTEGHGRKLG